MLLFAVLIAVRGRDARGSGILATALAVDALSWSLYAIVTPTAWTMAVVNSIGLALTPLARFVLLTRYFSVFGQPLQGMRLWWTRLAYGTAIVSVLAVAMLYFYVFDIARLPLSSLGAEEVFAVLFQCAVVPVMVCGILAVRAARTQDSARIAWVTGSYGMFFTFWTLAGRWDFFGELTWPDVADRGRLAFARAAGLELCGAAATGVRHRLRPQPGGDLHRRFADRYRGVRTI